MIDLHEHLDQLGYPEPWSDMATGAGVERVKRNCSAGTVRHNRIAEKVAGVRQDMGRAALCRRCGDRGYYWVHASSRRPVYRSCGCGFLRVRSTK